MRSHVVPWLSSSSPNLDMGQKQGQNSSSAAPQMTQTELEAMLTPKHMSESYTSFDLPLASDPELLDKYVNASGGLRMGKLLEREHSLTMSLRRELKLQTWTRWPALWLTDTSCLHHQDCTTRPPLRRPRRSTRRRPVRDCTSLQPVQTDSTCLASSVAQTSGE